ncbi:MAG: nitrite reductase/ring-hydroxylating ferredoxin subunit [Natronomonas sp.]|jgi:nitrite reductase/ring-hydroxylating ferredoxin subunit|uniref:Rieske (2Fe-2S) protein n=1 Tax=Natronomonas sp. TaxID=2184060 RepID=UPI0039898D4D
MAARYPLTSVETVKEEGSWLFTARNSDGEATEVLLVPCDTAEKPPVEAWVNRCTHENQRLYRDGGGAVIREGGVVCPKHGSVFDACSGFCDNGEAADSTLFSVGIDIEDGQVYLRDGEMTYLQDGAADDDDDSPESTSHLRF